MEFQADVKDYVLCEIETLEKLNINAINDVLDLLLKMQENHKRNYIFGNDGS